jgi:Flp pilus assembly protein TadD
MTHDPPWGPSGPGAASRRVPPAAGLTLWLVLSVACTGGGADRTAVPPSVTPPASAAAGFDLLRRGDLAGAEPHLAAALERSPRDRRLLEALGSVYARTDRPRQAEAVFRRALAAEPAAPGARLGLAAVLIDTGRFEEALREIAEVRRIDPDNPAALVKEGLLLARGGRPEEAAGAARRALARRPDDAEAHYVLGLALQQGGDAAGAEEAMRAVHRLAPAHLGALSHLAILAARRGDAAAAAGWRRLHRDTLGRQRVEERVRTHRLKAVEAFNREDYATALEALGAIVREDPSDPQVHLHLGSTYLALGRLAEARAALDRSLVLDPRGDRALTELGRLHAMQGNLDDAIAALDRAIALNPEFAEPHYYLAGIHRAQGDADRFRQEMRRFEELRARSAGSPMEIVTGEPGEGRR